ncbi:MAG: response regulator [Anaerolinea sp.]|nr:response regulator [Anaerolinea sp.]
MKPAPRILILEDEFALRRLMKLMLQREGFEVLDATHGQEALDLIAEHGLPDIALVDLMMPVMNGEEFARAVKNNGWKLPAIFVSASPEAQEVCTQLGFACVKKPYDFSILLATIRDELAAAGSPAA